MSFSIGIVGLPNVGKSTLFKALTKKQVDIADYPFTTINPNVGVVAVPDERLEKIAQVIKPEKVTPTIIEFVDIAGLVKNAHKGEGLGNQFLAQIRNCDAILEVIKCFSANPTPDNDIEIIKTELAMKDLEVEEKENLLSKKPIVYVYNINEVGHEVGHAMSNGHRMSLNLKIEEEMSELSEAEKRELGVKSQLDQLILACYNILELITFYTITGGQETRAWTLQRGQTCPQAGGKVHSDFQEKFIRAEVINWQKLVEAGSWAKAREKGWLETVGRDYIVQDGDVIEFKI
ncbi:MAG: redox-regulated ATPase YchF [Candidatus Nealsonbacteria bacterium CG09_land_8_20_14_0_10_42_14]|uniref:Redox-regulated ATPase YchF n=1 Tax=Candidatus Nealsonbacteria bacterium CG09_land_8_20_14_0_10_42_14 TaxID=1974707 RepID=A0A2H0WXR0_9BACT|nr:MAG: redox-regulated ATPase YchF [Candidatus Nealsonbacteria bacterium CG09_land_8_20_14_0_10_42_14]